MQQRIKHAAALVATLGLLAGTLLLGAQPAPVVHADSPPPTPTQVPDGAGGGGRGNG